MMSKVLEALKALDTIEDTRYDLSILGDFDDALVVIRKALTPPTVEEMCEALSKYWEAEVKYNPNRNHGFYLVMSRIYFMCLGYDGEIQFYHNDYIVASSYPPHLVTLIGRFYEGSGN